MVVMVVGSCAQDPKTNRLAQRSAEINSCDGTDEIKKKNESSRFIFRGGRTVLAVRFEVLPSLLVVDRRRHSRKI